MLSFIVQLSTKLVRFKIDRLIDRYVYCSREDELRLHKNGVMNRYTNIKSVIYENWIKSMYK